MPPLVDGFEKVADHGMTCINGWESQCGRLSENWMNPINQLIRLDVWIPFVLGNRTAVTPLIRLDTWVPFVLENRTFVTPSIRSTTDCFGRPFPKNRNPSIR